MRRVTAIMWVAIGWSWMASSALAQSNWQELETMIRQQRNRNAADADPMANPKAVVAASLSSEALTPSAAIERGYLGILADDTNDRGRGVRVMRVKPGSPAEQAGLETNDLITELAEVRIRALSDMSAVLEQLAPGHTLVFKVLRGQRRQEIPVTLGNHPSSEPTAGEPTLVSTAPATPAEAVEKVVEPSQEKGEAGAAPAVTTPTWKLPGLSAFTAPTKQLPGAPSSEKVAPANDGEEVLRLRQQVQQLKKRVEELEEALAEKK